MKRTAKPKFSTRAEILTRRTYNRPLDSESMKFETWEQTVDRVIGHQRWLWERQLAAPLDEEQKEELQQLRTLIIERKSITSGRTLWLGGTEVAKRREASQFNCAFGEIQTVHDVVDSIWLLLQGCGVGFRAEMGVINGFAHRIPKIQVIRSERTTKGGEENNKEYVYVDMNTGKRIWRIVVGDSAESWAKAFGKLVAGKHTVDRLIFDLTEIRPAGERLKGYGWISSGDEALSIALVAIAKIFNKKHGQLLTRIDLLDVENWLGTILSSRRSSEIAIHRFGDPEWEDFSKAKANAYPDNMQRFQSNNSLVFYNQPTKLELRGLFQMMIDAGGSEPGFINGAAALKRAPWFKGVNPCAEILLGNKSFCNLVDTNLAAFNGDFEGLLKAHRLIARANYRQTCVNLRDGVLQDSWHELNEFLRLCGVGATGITSWEFQLDGSAWRALRKVAQQAVNDMADELALPHSKAVTTIKPSGTLSKIMDTTEGIHKPLGRYIFNNVNFGHHDPLLPLLRAAGYKVWKNPSDATGTLATFPVAWEDIDFTEVEHNGEIMHVNLESAVDQLKRYKIVMDNYVDHNCSITISYDPSEVPAIVNWLDANWDTYVGVSWLFRADPTKTAKDLGYAYLPQQVVTKAVYEEYAKKLKPINLEDANSHDMINGEECVGGVCPVR